MHKMLADRLGSVNDYQCKVCGQVYVVRVLARDCEQWHRDAIAELATDITDDTPPDRIIRTR